MYDDSEENWKDWVHWPTCEDPINTLFGSYEEPPSVRDPLKEELKIPSPDPSLVWSAYEEIILEHLYKLQAAT